MKNFLANVFGSTPDSKTAKQDLDNMVIPQKVVATNEHRFTFKITVNTIKLSDDIIHVQMWTGDEDGNPANFLYESNDEKEVHHPNKVRF